MKQYVREEWDSFATAVMAGSTIPNEQRAEMKRSFYAGCASMLRILSEAMQPGSLPTDKDIKVIDFIVKELRDWSKVQQRLDAQNAMKNAATNPPMNPVQADVMRHMEAMARRCAQALDEATDNAFNQRALGFTLFIFSFAGAELTYISNAERPAMIKTLYEFLAANPPAMTWDEQHG